MHSLSTSPNLMTPNGTNHYLTVHSVDVPGKYTCQVYSIEGKQLDHVTHKISIKGLDINSHIMYMHLLLH